MELCSNNKHWNAESNAIPAILSQPNEVTLPCTVNHLAYGGSMFQNCTEIERIRLIAGILEQIADNYESVDTEKQQMYLVGMDLWTQDLQQAVTDLKTEKDTSAVEQMSDSIIHIYKNG
jgi:hypothetical protein